MLEGFELYVLPKGDIAIMLSKTGGINFSVGAVKILQKYKHVAILINYNQKLLAVQATSDEENSICFNKKAIRIHNKNLIETVKKLTGKEFTDSITSYRFNGEYSVADKAIIFDLKSIAKKAK